MWGRAHLAMLSKTASMVLSSHWEWRNWDDYVPASSPHFWIRWTSHQMLVFPVIIEGLNVFCLGYQVSNLKRVKPGLFRVFLQGVRIFTSTKAAVYWGSSSYPCWVKNCPHQNHLLEDSSDTNQVKWVSVMLFQMVCSWNRSWVLCWYCPGLQNIMPEVRDKSFYKSGSLPVFGCCLA